MSSSKNFRMSTYGSLQGIEVQGCCPPRLCFLHTVIHCLTSLPSVPSVSCWSVSPRLAVAVFPGRLKGIQCVPAPLRQVGRVIQNNGRGGAQKRWKPHREYPALPSPGSKVLDVWRDDPRFGHNLGSKPQFKQPAICWDILTWP